jgi:hypothetical protein
MRLPQSCRQSLKTGKNNADYRLKRKSFGALRPYLIIKSQELYFSFAPDLIILKGTPHKSRTLKSSRPIRTLLVRRTKKLFTF